MYCNMCVNKTFSKTIKEWNNAKFNYIQIFSLFGCDSTLTKLSLLFQNFVSFASMTPIFWLDFVIAPCIEAKVILCLFTSSSPFYLMYLIYVSAAPHFGDKGHPRGPNVFCDLSRWIFKRFFFSSLWIGLW